MTPSRCSLCGQRPPASGCVRCELRAAGARGLAPADPPEVRARHHELERARRQLDARRRRLVRRYGALRVALVGCGRKKRPGRHPARRLYTSSLFRAAVRHAQASAHEVFVLSAEHGLVELDQVLDNYDARLPTQQDERRLWGQRVESSIRLRFVGLPLAIDIYAGVAYAQPLRYAARSNGWRFAEPLRGLGVGARLQWFARRRGDNSTQLALSL